MPEIHQMKETSNITGKKIRIAVASTDGHSLSGHAGSTTTYLVYHCENGHIIERKILEIPPRDTLRNVFHTPGRLKENHPLFQVDYLLVTSLGESGVKRLKRKGVQALIVDEYANPGTAIEKLLNGTLKTYEPHRHHHHDHHDHHDHES